MRIFISIHTLRAVSAIVVSALLTSVGVSAYAQTPEAQTPASAEEATPAEAPDEIATPAEKPADASLDTMLDGADDELNRLIDEASQDSSLGAWSDREAERSPIYPYLEHHGYFRFRSDIFWNGHLGLSLSEANITSTTPASIRTTAIPPPLRENWQNNTELQGGNSWFEDEGSASTDARTLASANLRFRYQPTFHISPSMRIRSTFDVLDNVVMGSTPDFSGNGTRADVPLVAFSGSQAPPTAGQNGSKDSIQVKEAYAEWQPAFLLRAGRMASHWGLGILANGGSDIDDDYGDYADRVMLGLKLYGMYIVTAYDFVYSGVTTDSHDELFGQPKDLGTDDNVHQGILSVFQRPMSAEEKAQREVAYRENFEPIFDWGLYTVFRSQDLDYSTGGYEEWLKEGYSATLYDDLTLQQRGAWAVVPDLWFRYMQRFDYFSGLRVEFEAAAVVGRVDHAIEDPDKGTQHRKIEQFAGALEVEYDYREFTVGVHTGFASGDDAEGFGVQGDDKVLFKQDGSPNDTVTAFKFDRNYHVDLLLFREMIGTITNAYYIRPFVAYDLFDSVEDALGARFDIIYGHALVPEATPGNVPELGLEFDLSLFYEEKNRFNFDLEFGLLVPVGATKEDPQTGEEHMFSAFDYAQGSTREYVQDVAFTFQARMTLQF